jgi:hypothetical protein
MFTIVVAIFIAWIIIAAFPSVFALLVWLIVRILDGPDKPADLGR